MIFSNYILNAVLIKLFYCTVCNKLLLFIFYRVRVRYQKRQKLQFETKLGMNSPF